MSRTTRSRISSSATTIAAWRASSRSRSPTSPAPARDDQPVAARAVAGDRHRDGDGAARERALLGHEQRLPRVARSAPRPARGSRLTASAEIPRSAGWRASSPPRSSSSSAAPPTLSAIAAHHLGQAALGEHQPLELGVHLDAALEHVELLVDELREGALGDRDERRLVRHLEKRQAAPTRPPRRSGSGSPSWSKPVPSPTPAAPRSASSLTKRRWRVGAGQVDPGRQQQLAAGQKRRRVLELGDVDPADPARLGPEVEGGLEPEIVEQACNGEHRSSAAAPRPGSAPGGELLVGLLEDRAQHAR